MEPLPRFQESSPQEKSWCWEYLRDTAGWIVIIHQRGSGSIATGKTSAKTLHNFLKLDGKASDCENILLGFNSPLEVRFFFFVLRSWEFDTHIFFYWRSSFHLISSPSFNNLCPSFPSVRGRSIFISGRLPSVLTILSQTVFAICHNQVLQFCICLKNKWPV